MGNSFAIEKEYRNYLKKIKSLNMTSNSIRENNLEYNRLAENTMAFIENVALLSIRNRNLINSTGYDFYIFADDVTMHILDKIDKVLSCPEDKIISFVMTLTNNKVIDICRKWMRTYPSLSSKKLSGLPKDDNCSEERLSMFSFLDEVSWNLLASDIDIEADIIRKEDEINNHAAVLTALKKASSCTRFEILCLLATKVIVNEDNKYTKTRALAEAICSLGLEAVSQSFFNTTATVFNISYNDYFGSFSNDLAPKYSSIEDLCGKISRASNSCRVKLCKKIGAARPAKDSCSKQGFTFL